MCNKNETRRGRRKEEGGLGRRGDDREKTGKVTLDQRSAPDSEGERELERKKTTETEAERVGEGEEMRTAEGVGMIEREQERK